MNKTIIITNGKQTYSELMDKEYINYYCELVSNGANKEMLDISFNHWTRCIEDNVTDLEKYNTCDINYHFIFGWFESFSQSDNVPQWMYNSDNLKIYVIEGDNTND